MGINRDIFEVNLVERMAGNPADIRMKEISGEYESQFVSIRAVLQEAYRDDPEEIVMECPYLAETFRAMRRNSQVMYL